MNVFAVSKAKITYQKLVCRVKSDHIFFTSLFIRFQLQLQMVQKILDAIHSFKPFKSKEVIKTK